MASVRTVADKRVVAEQGVVLNQYVGPLNWEHYKIPASGLSNTQITFANFVTLGTNRIYDSGFQIEYTIEVTFNASMTGAGDDVLQNIRMHPFPLHWVTDQLRCNINGAACMVRPQESLPQRMMYWRQRVLDKSCNYCPHTKAPVGRDNPIRVVDDTPLLQQYLNYQMRYGKNGSQDVGTPLPCVNFAYDSGTRKATITFREPLLCPPFNQRLDEIYQSPLFNITSMDMVYQLNDLKRMFISSYVTTIANSSGTPAVSSADLYGLVVSNITSVNIASAQLCFNVASMPPGMTVPSTLQLPYYDNVCYVTNAGTTGGSTGPVTITSGVYTLAQVPTAIYIFVSENQGYRQTPGNYDPTYCPIRDINITMGNNTQLLTTTTEYDRYQMAVANGLEDVTWEEFTRTGLQFPTVTGAHDWGKGLHGNKCILRLIPGVDLLIPDKRLVGGTDADQLVFQVRLTADVSDTPGSGKPSLALWIMFEYCGVLTIEPVHASIDMIPLKTMPPIGEPDVIADVGVDAASGGGEGTNPRGAGVFDILGLAQRAYQGAKRIFNSKIGKKVRRFADSVLDPQSVMDDSSMSDSGGRIMGGTIVGNSVLGKYIQ